MILIKVKKIPIEYINDEENYKKQIFNGNNSVERLDELSSIKPKLNAYNKRSKSVSLISTINNKSMLYLLSIS